MSVVQGTEMGQMGEGGRMRVLGEQKDRERNSNEVFPWEFTAQRDTAQRDTRLRIGKSIGCFKTMVTLSPNTFFEANLSLHIHLCKHLLSTSYCDKAGVRQYKIQI